MPWIFSAGVSVLVHHVERDTKDAWEAYRNMCLTCYLLCFSLVLLIIFLLIYKLTPIHRNCLKSILPFLFSRLPDNYLFKLYWKGKKKLKYLSLSVFLWIIFSIDDKDCWLCVDIYILYIEICCQKRSLRCIFLGQ